MTDSGILAIGLCAALIVAAAVFAAVLLRGRAGGAAATADRLAALGGMIEQMTTGAAANHAELRRALEERLADVGTRVGNSLTEQGRHQQAALAELKERLAVIDSAQKKLSELSGQVVGLQEVLSSPPARGAFGEVQLENLVISMLPPSAYGFQAAVGGSRRADCLIKLPNPPGAIAVDAKFPLEGYRALREASDAAARSRALRTFSSSVQKHVNDIAERYIVPGETADSALMFIPSEAVYAELHASLPEVVEKAYRRRVYMVSPTTLMATLNTMRAVMRDASMREQAHVIQVEVAKMLDDVARLDERVENLARHFDQAGRDIEQIRTSSEKITRRGTQITEIELADGTAADGPQALAATPGKRLGTADIEAG